MPVLVRAGVARPYDAENAIPRMMNRFTFVIDELSEVGESSLSASGVDTLRRYGAPAYNGVGDMVKSLMDHIARWLTRVFTSAGNLAKKGAEYDCKGVAAVNDLTSAASGSAQVLWGAPGLGSDALALSSAGIARNAAIGMCDRFVTPAVPTCRPGTADIVIEGRCVDLPEMELAVDLGRSAYYAPPPGNDGVIEWVEPDAAGG